MESQKSLRFLGNVFLAAVTTQREIIPKSKSKSSNIFSIAKASISHRPQASIHMRHERET